MQGPVALSEDEWDDHLTARHAGHRSWRLLCLVGRDRVSMIFFFSQDDSHQHEARPPHA